MSNNLSQFHSFKDSLKSKKQLANGDWQINAKVIYKWLDKMEEEMLVVYVRLAGMDGGRIALDEGEVINVKQRIHMDFNSAFENPVFDFNEDGILKIKGRSAPHLGSFMYEVIIIPVK